jgi:nitroreductase
VSVVGALLADYRPAASLRPGAIDGPTLDAVLECARLAPSANNSQPWRFNVVRDARTIGGVAERIAIPGLGGAGLLLAVSAKESLISNRWKQQPFMMIDVPIACLHLVLAAQERGIASRIVLSFDRKGVAAALAIPRGEPLVALVFLGSAETTGARAAVRREVVVRFDRY